MGPGRQRGRSRFHHPRDQCPRDRPNHPAHLRTRSPAPMDRGRECDRPALRETGRRAVQRRGPAQRPGTVLTHPGAAQSAARGSPEPGLIALCSTGIPVTGTSTRQGPLWPSHRQRSRVRARLPTSGGLARPAIPEHADLVEQSVPRRPATIRERPFSFGAAAQLGWEGRFAKKSASRCNMCGSSSPLLHNGVLVLREGWRL